VRAVEWRECESYSRPTDFMLTCVVRAFRRQRSLLDRWRFCYTAAERCECTRGGVKVLSVSSCYLGLVGKGVTSQGPRVWWGMRLVRVTHDSWRLNSSD
jgi:hypothetical protein